MSEEKPIDDLPMRTMQIVLVRELLRAVGLYWELHQDEQVSAGQDEMLLLAVLRALHLSSISNDADTSLSALYFLQEARKEFPQEIYDVRGGSFIGILQNVLLSSCADAFSNASSSSEHLQQAVDTLHRLGKLGSKPGLEYDHEGLLILVSGDDQLQNSPLFLHHTDNFDADGPPSWTSEQRFGQNLPLLRSLRRSGPTWTYWHKWYWSMLRGEALPLSLRIDVTKIPDEYWNEGPDAVAEAIAKIEFNHRTSAVQRLVRNDEKRVFELEEEPLPPKEIADFVSARIENVLNAALQSVSPNIFNENSYEVIVIRDTLASEPRSISILATGFYDAALALQKNNGTLYPEEVALTNLMNALGAATEELCELDEDAKRRCAVLASYNPVKSVDDLPVEDLLLIPETVADQVSDPARKIIESDVERALSKERPPTKTIRIRLSNWLTTISIWMDRAMKGDKKAKWLADVVKRLRDWWPDE